MKVSMLNGSQRERILKEIVNEEVIDLAKKIISIPSCRTSLGQETPVAEFIKKMCRDEGIESYLQDVEDGRCNVVAKIAGNGDGPSIMLNGHIDTVPAKDMERPFDPYIKEDRLYGRGSSDMKGGIAAMVYALICLKRSNLTFKGDIFFTGVIGEEEALSQGTLYVCKNGPHADMVVVGEPTNLETVIAHKGFDNYLIKVSGVTAHSSVPEVGVNAIVKASHVINGIQEQMLPIIQQRRHRYLGNPKINIAAIIGSTKNDSSVLQEILMGEDSKHNPGGSVPEYCNIYIDRRRIPGEKMDDILADFQNLLDDLRADDPSLVAQVYYLKPNNELPTHPPLETDVNHMLVQNCLYWTNYVTGKIAEPVGVPFWTDGAIFGGLYGIPTIIYGPANIDTAHSKNDNVPVNDLIVAAKVYALLSASICS